MAVISLIYSVVLLVIFPQDDTYIRKHIHYSDAYYISSCLVFIEHVEYTNIVLSISIVHINLQ